jgi:hypothetical protein
MLTWHQQMFQVTPQQQQQQQQQQLLLAMSL